MMFAEPLGVNKTSRGSTVEITIQLGTLIAILVPVFGVFAEYVRRNRQLTKMITDAVDNLKTFIQIEDEKIRDTLREDMNSVNDRIDRTNDRMQSDYARKDELSDVKTSITEFRKEVLQETKALQKQISDLISTLARK